MDEITDAQRKNVDRIDALQCQVAFVKLDRFQGELLKAEANVVRQCGLQMVAAADDLIASLIGGPEL